MTPRVGSGGQRARSSTRLELPSTVRDGLAATVPKVSTTSPLGNPETCADTRDLTQLAVQTPVSARSLLASSARLWSLALCRGVSTGPGTAFWEL